MAKKEESRGGRVSVLGGMSFLVKMKSISGCVDVYVVTQSFHYACESHDREVNNGRYIIKQQYDEANHVQTCKGRC